MEEKDGGMRMEREREGGGRERERVGVVREASGKVTLVASTYAITNYISPLSLNINFY